MARAPAEKKSRPSASRSNTTTASSAKAAKKTADDSRDKWEPRDQGDALAQGWGVFECIDERTLKIFFEIQSEGVRFAHDALAREFVMNRNKAGDDLAIKALRVVFRSKAGYTTKRK